MSNIILTDIEGTITDIDFVKNTLFPYAYKHLPAFLREQQHEKKVQAIVAQLREQMHDANADIEKIISQCLFGYPCKAILD